MEANRNWAGIAALVLAGLALFVALAGRSGFDGPGNTVGYAVAAPDGSGFKVLPWAQAMPVMPGTGGSTQAVPWAQVQPGQVVPVAPDTKPVVPDDKGVPPMVYAFQQAQDSGNYPGARWHAFAAHFFSVIPHLLQLVGLLALIFLAVRFFSRRGRARSGPAVE